MTKDEFMDQISRLQEVYGDKAFSNERVQLIWEKYSDLDIRAWHEIISGLISYERYAPMLDAIDISVRQYKSRNITKYQPTKELIEQMEECSSCGRQGFVTAEHKSNRSIYALRCQCIIGDLYGFNYPKWDGGLNDQYELLRLN